jgi:translocation and assembly module TamA
MSRSRLGVACVAVALGCHGGGPVRHPGEQYVAKIRVEGNHALTSDALINGLALRRREDAGVAVDEYQLTQDVTRIVGAYEKLGYFRVEVHPRVEHQGDAEDIVLAISEGPRATVTVEIDGLPADISPQRARQLVKLVDHGPFDYAAYDAAKEPLLKLVEDASYAHARLDAGVVADRAHDRATVRYVFDPGPQCTFGPVSVTGVHGALLRAVDARVEIHAGQRYSSEALLDTQRALYGMGRFSTVRVDFDQTSNDPVVTVRVALTEGNRHEFRAGGGVGIDPINYSLRARATYTQVGFPFPLSTIGVDFRPEYTYLQATCGSIAFWTCANEPRVRLIGTLTQQDFLVPKLRLELEGGLDFLTIEAYTIEGVHGRVGLSMPLGTPRVQAHVGWLVGIYQFVDVNEALLPDAQDQIGISTTVNGVTTGRAEQLGTFNESLTLDLRDRPIEPHYGIYAEARVTEGTRYAGGAFNYTQITPELRGYVPIAKAVLALRARVGEFFGDIPPTERYYSGGASSDRGYPERQLSPIATNGPDTVVIGGGGLAEASAELRVPAGKLLGLATGGVAFIDGGDVEMTASQLDIWQLHWAAGVGFRWFLLPIGPLRVDVAYRFGLDSANLPTLSRFQWFLGIGEAF